MGVSLIWREGVNLRGFSNGGEILYKTKLNDAGKLELLRTNPLGSFSDFNFSRNSRSFIFSKQSVAEQSKYSCYSEDSKQIFSFANSDSSKLVPSKLQRVKWLTPLGTVNCGYLYFPFDFDAKKRYPVIIDCYEFRHRVVTFEEVVKDSSMSAGYLKNYLLSHSYFYFVPDILYKPGELADRICNSVISAAKYLAVRPYIDAKRIGIISGGLEGHITNMLIARTDIFAAACTRVGMTNLFSAYGTETINERGYSYPTSIETGMIGMGVTPWERPDLYIKSSPVFYADKVKTPVLFEMGRKDDAILTIVPPAQCMEFFIALRRLGKKAWLISYDDGGHFGSYNDFNRRTMQFFDHYLKGALPPVWMTRGIPATMKGKTLGFELDNSIKAPLTGLPKYKEIRTPGQSRLLENETSIDSNGKIIPN